MGKNKKPSQPDYAKLEREADSRAEVKATAIKDKATAEAKAASKKKSRAVARNKTILSNPYKDDEEKTKKKSLLGQ